MSCVKRALARNQTTFDLKWRARFPPSLALVRQEPLPPSKNYLAARIKRAMPRSSLRWYLDFPGGLRLGETDQNHAKLVRIRRFQRALY